MKRIEIVILTLILITGVVLSSSIAEAANRYALTCIANSTQVTVNYKVRWGDGIWRSSSISPGRYNWHSWKYKHFNDNSSPRLQVNFDSDLSNATYWQTYNLKKHASPQKGDCKKYGKQYGFKYDGSSRDYIDLKTFGR